VTAAGNAAEVFPREHPGREGPSLLGGSWTGCGITPRTSHGPAGEQHAGSARSGMLAVRSEDFQGNWKDRLTKLDIEIQGLTPSQWEGVEPVGRRLVNLTCESVYSDPIQRDGKAGRSDDLRGGS
jgi:hypothetical protein